MGVSKIPRLSLGVGGVDDTLVHSEFSEFSLGYSDSDSSSDDGFGVTVYNLGESEIPEGIDFEDEYNGYFCIMDVGEPVTITSRASLFKSTFTSYLIRVETNYPTFSTKFCSVRRRYNEFCWLREQLVKNNLDRTVPVLPPKKMWSFNNFNASFIQERLRGLSLFLQRTLENPSFLRDPALLFFLQSELSVPEMQEIQAARRRGIRQTIVNVPIATEQNSLMVSSDGEDVEDDDDVSTLVPQSCSLMSSENSEDRFAKAVPIPVPCARVLHKFMDQNRKLSTSSSEGDSGHFEASSSASTSPNRTPAVLQVNPGTTLTAPSTSPPPAPVKVQGRYRPQSEITEKGHKFIPSPSSSYGQVNEYLLYHPVSAYFMQ